MHGEQRREHAREVKKYVREHLGEKITVASIAAELHLHPSYLNTGFHEVTGKTVTDYIREEKNNRAKELLKNDSLTLAEICSMLGYFDQSHFSRIFKRTTGYTPGAYRAKKK